MKITIVLGPFQPLPPAGFGAVEKIWFGLARCFAEAGHAVTVIGKGARHAQGRATPATLCVSEVAGYAASGRLGLDLAKDFAYAVGVIRRIPASDVVVTNSFWLPVVLAPLRRRKGRIVVHVARFPKGQMFLYRCADAIQTVSTAVAAEIRRQCAALSGRISVVGNPIDLALYRPRAGIRGDSGGSRILYVGRIHPEKGLDVLVEAFRRVRNRVPNACLRLVGPAHERQGGGGEAYLRRLQSAAEGLPVEFAGAVADPAVLAAEYLRADCFCYPSLAERGEAFGLAALEAMASGLPCVVSALACFEDFLTDGADGLVFDHRSPDAAAALADRLCVLLTDAALAARLGRGARAVAERYSFENVAGQYLALFSAVAAAPTGSHA